MECVEIDAVLKSAEDAMRQCCIMMGGHVQYASVGGQKVGTIRQKFRTTMNIPNAAAALVKGKHVDEELVLLPGQTLQFLNESGEKGLGDLLTPKELMERWQIGKAEYHELLDLGLPSIRLETGLFHPEIAVDEWFKQMVPNGSGEAAPLDNGDRIPRPTNGTPYLDSKQGAAYLGITVKSLYGLVERRQLAPLRASKRQYRFTEDMLDKFLRRKDGV
jgi:hypothetical protein